MYADLVAGYSSMEHELDTIKLLISQRRNYDEELKARLINVKAVEGGLKEKGPKELDNENLKLKCQTEVKQELPLNHFFIPEEKV